MSGKNILHTCPIQPARESSGYRYTLKVHKTIQDTIHITQPAYSNIGLITWGRSRARNTSHPIRLLAVRFATREIRRHISLNDARDRLQRYIAHPQLIDDLDLVRREVIPRRYVGASKRRIRIWPVGCARAGVYIDIDVV